MIRSRSARKRSKNSGVSYEAFEPRKMLATILAGDLNSGVAVSEDATGFGLIVYSQQDVHERFSGIPATNADHFFAARRDGVQLQYNNDSQWINFELLLTDIGVAEVNFDGDNVSRSLLPLAADNDLFVVANQFGGQFDENEFQVLGTQFQSFDFPEGQTALEFIDDIRISRIWNGIRGYESSFGHFPTLANFDDAGTPLLSWRVHILPQLGFENLYEQFRLDEAWDSPHNLALADQMPEFFRSGNFESGNRTTFLAVAGEDTIFPLDNTPQDFSNERSLALVEVDAAQSVIWTEPVDWYFNEADPLAGLGNASADGFTAIDTESLQYTLTDQIDTVAFANFVTINDGEPIDNTVFAPDQNLFERPALRDLGLAVANYESSFWEFPEQSIKAEDGTPLLSWRVAILPFLGHNNLYNQFNLDEPWDSPHNIQLLDNMPNLFAHPEVESGLTVFLGLDGDGTLFDSNRTQGINFGTIRDGATNTIAIVEADVSQAVEWSRPVDLNYDPANPSNGLGGLIGDGTFNAVLADGFTVLNFQPTTAANLDAWASIDGGEVSDYSFTNALEIESTARNFQNINWALLNFESARQEFPRTIYSDNNGSPDVPLLSWRVAILPYIGEDNLYRQFNLDEPWDSPNNLSLLPLIPRVFASAGLEVGKTVVQGAHGDNTFFSNINDGRGFNDFRNNTNVATILEVNADQAIEWTKPGDFDFDANNLSTVLGEALPSGFHVGLIDGSVHFFNNTISDDVLNKILSPADFTDLLVDFKVLRDFDSSLRFQRFEIQNNLRELALGAINFESATTRFPAHAIYSQPRDGEPLLSWRVELLPFLGYEELYDRFNLDEPWDSPNNLALLPLMPEIFRTVGIENGKTVFQAVTSQPDADPTIFPLSNSSRTTFGSISDGSFNTVLFVQAEDDRAVEWTKPEDLIFDPADPTNGVSIGTRAEGTHVVTADGSTHYIPGNVTEEFWAALILRSDGEVVDPSNPILTSTGTIVPQAATVFDENDTFIVTVTGDVVQISVNGSVSTENITDVGSLFFNGMEGTDTLTLNTGGLPVTIVDGVLDIGGLFTIETDSVESIDLGDSPIVIQGTDGDDTFAVTVVGDRPEITINGVSFAGNLVGLDNIVFDGLGGSDTLLLNSGDIPVSIVDGAFQVGNLFTVETNSVESIDLGGSPIVIQGTDSDDTFVVTVANNLTVITVNGASVAENLVGLNNVVFNGLGGTDTLLLDATVIEVTGSNFEIGNAINATIESVETIDFDDNFVFFRGTQSDDTFAVTDLGDRTEFTVNGVSLAENMTGLELVFFLGLGSTDTLLLDTGASPATITGGEIRINDLYIFVPVDIETVDFGGSPVTVRGTSAEDIIELTLVGDRIEIITNGNSVAENLVGLDQLVFDGLAGTDTLVVDAGDIPITNIGGDLQIGDLLLLTTQSIENLDLGGSSVTTQGTDNDDTFIVTVSGDVVEISVNGVARTENVNNLGNLVFDGLGGSDTLILNTGEIPITIIDGDFRIGDLFLVAIENIETIDFDGSPVTIQGTQGSDGFAVTVTDDGTAVSISGVNFPQTLTGLGRLNLSGLEGSDTLILRTGDIPVTVFDGVFQIGDLFSITSDTFELIAFTDSPVTFQGTDGDDTWIVDVTDDRSVTAAGFDVPLFLVDTAELNIDGAGGADQIQFNTNQNARVGYESFESGGLTTRWANVNSIDVQGQLQDDNSVRFLDSVRDDVFSFRGSNASMTSDEGILVSADGFSSFLIGATEGNDVARLSGTADTDDTFVGGSTVSRLTTPNVNVIASGFDLVAATSSGGDDFASLNGTEATETFFGGSESARLVGDDFVLNATGFQRVLSNSGGGDDTANFTDSQGDDQFFARPEFGSLALGNGKTVTALNYGLTRAASTAGTDSAQLVGSDGADRLIARTNDFARLTGDDSTSVAVGFSTVRANGLIGADDSFLTGSDGDDFFFASATTSFLNGDGFQNTLQGFESVVAVDSLGRDTALFEDSAGDESFFANSTLASIQGGTFSRLALGFNSVRATSSGGNDTAVLRDSDGDDRFFASPTTARLLGDGYSNVVEGFSQVRAVSTLGNDLATLEDSAGDDALFAFQASSALSGVGFNNIAAGFDSVTVNASTGNDSVELFDSQTDDRFFGREKSASLEGDSYFILANDFDTFDVFGFNGGLNEFFVGDTEFQWNRLGDWLP